MSVERARHDLTLLRTALTASSTDMYRDVSAYNPDGGLRAPGFTSTVLWERAGEIQRGYMAATAGIARAHRAMLTDDQVPGGWVRGLAWLELHPERRVPLASATVLNGVDLLDALLDQYPQSSGVKDACGHITGAVRSVVQSYLPPGTQQLSRVRRRCVHCGRKPAEDDRKWCSRCRRGHQRGACVVCRTTAA